MMQLEPDSFWKVMVIVLGICAVVVGGAIVAGSYALSRADKKCHKIDAVAEYRSYAGYFCIKNDGSVWEVPGDNK